MKTRKYILFILCLLFVLNIYAKKIGVVQDINKPHQMVVKGNRMYISELTAIRVYSVDDCKLIKTFGREGEGPGELKISHGKNGVDININDDFFLVNSAAKLSYFSHDGVYLQEKKIPPMVVLIPVQDNYAGNCMTQVGKPFPVLSVCLFDSRFNRIKTLVQSDIPMGMGAKIMMPAYNFNYLVEKNKIFVSAGTKNIQIRIFDIGGTELYQIKKDVVAFPVTESYKKEVRQFYRTDPVYKTYWEYFKKYLEFYKNFPAVKNFVIDNHIVYVQTHIKENSRSLWWCFDLSGNEIGNHLLPLVQGSPVASPLYAISNSTFYYLQENLDTETWELFKRDLKK